MDSKLDLMKEPIWVLQLAPLNDINMEILMVHFMGYKLDEKTELNWDLQMEVQIGLKLDLMKEPIWVLQLAPLKDIIMARLMVQLIGSQWYNKVEMY